MHIILQIYSGIPDYSAIFPSLSTTLVIYF